jgi:bifunctional UDP-N-acetylglucosamine pyrophosphorylase/glucosamine-1-phosphate N-acetyltransferase
MPPAEADLWQSLNDWSAAIAAVQASGWVVDLDKPWHILNANRLAAQQMTAAISQTVVHPSARVSASARIEGAVSVGEGSEIGPGVLITGNAVIGARTRVTNGAILKGGSIVGDDTRISDYCHVNGETVVGNRCVVGHGAEMAGVVFDGAYLYHYCEVCGVVGLSVDIGAATVCGTLRFDDGEAVHRVKGRRERPSTCANATYFGDYSRTGVNVITTPGAKIGCYSCVGPGVVVYGDVASGKLVLLKQELIERDWGPQRYGW